MKTLRYEILDDNKVLNLTIKSSKGVEILGIKTIT